MLMLLTLMACSGDDSGIDTTENAGGDFDLTELFPANDALDVPLDTNIVAQFNKDLRVGDIGVVGRRSVSGIDGNTLTAELSEPLDLLTTYTVQTLGITSVDGDAFADIQASFTSRDGTWQAAESIAGQTDTTRYAAAVSGETTVLFTAGPEGIEVLTLTGGIPSEPVVLDQGDVSFDTWLVANDDESVAAWTHYGDVFISSTSADGIWSAPLPMRVPTFDAQTPTGLAITDDGTVAVSWRVNTLKTQVTTRVEGEWSAPIDLGCAAQGECSSVSLSVDHTGGFSAMILATTDGGQRIETSSFRNNAWTAPQVLFDVDGDIAEPVVHVQADETLAMWRVTNSEDAGLYQSRLSDDNTWSDVIQVRDGDGITSLDMVALADGSWTAAWIEVQPDSEVDSTTLWVSGVEDTALTDPFRLIESTTAFGQVDLLADAGGNLHLTWTELSEPARLLTRRFNHRTGWDDAVQLGTDTGPAQLLTLPGNRSHAVFIESDQLTTAFFE